ncbi:hypothetical protein D9M73_130370 [compost metagenome]
MALLARLHVLGTGLKRCLEHLFGIARGRRIGDQAHPVERMADRARCAEVAAILGHAGAHVGGGAVAVVGERLDDQRNAAGAEAFVADFLVILGVALRRLVDRALDIVLGHRLRLGGVDRHAQARVHVRIGQAHLGGDGDFAAELGKHARALLILRALAVHDVLIFGMACHAYPAKWYFAGTP